MHHYVKCEACNGQGYHYHAYNFEKDEVVECTPQTWECLPRTIQEARAHRQHYIRGLKEPCELCDGAGEVEYEEDFDPYEYE